MRKKVGVQRIGVLALIVLLLWIHIGTEGISASESDYEYKDVDGGVEITRYVGSAEEVTIPTILGGKNVVGIGANAFYNKSVTGIVLPDTLESIGDRAFGLNQLTEVTIGKNVTNVGLYLFIHNPIAKITVDTDNPKYKDVNEQGLYTRDGKRLVLGTMSGEIANETEVIGRYAFTGLGVQNITIPTSVTSIEQSAFSENELTSVVIPSNVMSMESFAFSENQLTNVDIKAKITTIEDFTFRDNLLTNIIIPEGVKSIGSGAFRDNQLSSIEFPNSLESFGNFVFVHNQLTSITLGENITSIGGSVFANNSLEQIEVDSLNPNYIDIDGKVLYTKDGKRLVQSTRSGKIADGTEIIGSGAFWGIELGDIIIPSSVTAIGNYAFRDSQLTSVVIPETVTSIGGDVFQSNPNLIIFGKVETKAESYALQNSIQFINIDEPYDAVVFTPNGSTEQLEKAETKVRVYSNETLKLQYQWSASPATPSSGAWIDFMNDSTITLPTGMSGEIYLHIRGLDTDEEIVFNRVSNSFQHVWNLFEDGDGTEDNPYIIETAEQLDAVRNDFDTHYKLGADIDLEGFGDEEGWKPIGNDSSPFNGNFDGAGFTITYLTINQVGNYQGLFGAVGTNGMIQNTSLKNVQINGISDSDYIGGLVGENRGTIENSSIVDGKVMGRSYIGGLVGRNKGVIMNSFTSITVESNGSMAGGLVGRSIASVGVPASISNSYATGEVRGGTTVGGLIGSNWFDDGGENEIINSYATGDVSGTGKYVGGLIGHNSAKTNGTIEITNSYATGNVVGTDEYVGGLIGVNDAYGEILINNSYATGKVSGTQTKIGGLVGGHSTNDNGTIKTYNSYWDIGSTGQENSAAGEGKTSEEMKQSGTYMGWDFDNTWYQYNGQTTPFFRWQNPFESVNISIGKSELMIGEETEIKVMAVHQNHEEYDGFIYATYTTNPMHIVEIDRGLITARKVGETTITIDLFGLKKSVNVNVSDVPVITPNAPVIGAVPEFVNTETVQLTGKAQAESVIQITGGSESASGIANATGTFEIDVPLNKNIENKLEVTATVDGLESEATRISILHDDIKPIITLKGDPVFKIHQGTSFTDPGATAIDNVDGEISTQIKVSGDTVDTSKLGEYTIDYNVTDRAGNRADPVSRTVKVNRAPSSGGGWVPSSNANLGKLEMSADGELLLFTPSFSSDKTTYSAQTDKEKIKLIASAAHTAGKVMLNGKALGEGIEIDLQVGENVFDLIVHAENGMKKTYTLLIHQNPEIPYKTITKEGAYAKNKLWTVKFSKEVDASTIQGALYVMDEKGYILPTRYTSDGNSIYIHAPIGGYAEGNYTLYITAEVEDTKGNPLKEPIKMYFTISILQKPDTDGMYKTMTKEGTFPRDKNWTVQLSIDVDPSTIEGALFLTDATGNPIDVTFTSDGNSIIISAPENGYDAGMYSLYITTALKDTKGNPLKEPIQMIFTID